MPGIRDYLNALGGEGAGAPDVPDFQQGQTVGPSIPPTPGPAGQVSPADIVPPASAGPEGQVSPADIVPDNTAASAGFTNTPPAGPPPMIQQPAQPTPPPDATSDMLSPQGKQLQGMMDALIKTRASGESDIQTMAQKIKIALGGDESEDQVPLTAGQRIGLMLLAFNHPELAAQQMQQLRQNVINARRRNAERNLKAQELAGKFVNERYNDSINQLKLQYEIAKFGRDQQNDTHANNLKDAEKNLANARAAAGGFSPAGGANRPTNERDIFNAAVNYQKANPGAPWEEALSVAKQNLQGGGAATGAESAPTPAASSTGAYKTKADVVAAFNAKKITRDQANQILATMR